MKNLLLAAAFIAALPLQAEPTTRRFSFDGTPVTPGQISVSADQLYSRSLGFGWEPSTKTNPTAKLFSVALPEGNYAVTVEFDATSSNRHTVKSEQRRLMLERADAGRHTFIAHLHTPIISTNQRVKLKARELETETVNWDEKLTLEFNGSPAALRSLVIAPTHVPTVFLAGDSTVCDQPNEPWNSWGQMLPRFFKPEVAVANYAQSGESIKSSLAANRFAKIFSTMRPGDYLFVQFGHNDMKDKATNALAVYRANLKKLVAQTRALGGTPLLVTSMERKSGVERDTLAGYPPTVRDVAAEDNVTLIDLHALSRIFYRALGTNLDLAFQDGTHHNNYGSYELAQCVVRGIQQSRLPLAKAIVDDFSFDPAKPDAAGDFALPASPNISTLKPLGN